jgi:hypothetical protein
LGFKDPQLTWVHVAVMGRKEEGGRACKRFDQVGTFPALAIFRPVAPPCVALEM